uniref:BED-type domain-containing protein n=1 Tax=Panagrolaimus sp. PS1159 TaxID=55785 RepID=A0AC35F7U2_9BILA
MTRKAGKKEKCKYCSRSYVDLAGHIQRQHPDKIQDEATDGGNNERKEQLADVTDEEVGDDKISTDESDQPITNSNQANTVSPNYHVAEQDERSIKKPELRAIFIDDTSLSLHRDGNAGVVAGASSKIKNLQNTLFSGGRQPPKPGDKPRPVTTILDYTCPESDKETPNEKELEKMSHPQRDRPRQANKRPPSRMPVITSDSANSVTNGISNGSAITNFPVKDSPPVVTQKPANTNKKIKTAPTKEPKSAYTHTETILTPSKKPFSVLAEAAMASSSSSHSYSPMPIVSDDEPYSAKRYNQMAKTFNEMLKDFNTIPVDTLIPAHALFM